MKLHLLEGRFALCLLDAAASLPSPPSEAELFALVMRKGERSLLCREEDRPAETACETGWRALVVEGPLPFTLVGLIAELSGLLAGAGIPLLTLATYETDILLVREAHLAKALAALEAGGHRVEIY